MDTSEKYLRIIGLIVAIDNVLIKYIYDIFLSLVWILRIAGRGAGSIDLPKAAIDEGDNAIAIYDDYPPGQGR